MKDKIVLDNVSGGGDRRNGHLDSQFPIFSLSPPPPHSFLASKHQNFSDNSQKQELFGFGHFLVVCDSRDIERGVRSPHQQLEDEGRSNHF